MSALGVLGSLIFPVLLIGLLLYVLFISTAHKDYKERRDLKEHKPRAYRKKTELNITDFPLYKNKESTDGIFLSLIFPAYNEEKRLGPALERAVNYFDTKDFKYEVIIVNDGSKDKTFDLMTTLAEKYSNVEIISVTYDKNGGKGYAVRTGFGYARGQYMLMLDSDGATDIKDYETLFNTIKDNDFAMAIGSRKIITEKADRVWYRNIMGTVNNFIVRGLIGVGEIKDTQCGFKLFTRKAARNIFSNLHLVRWAFDVDMLYIARKTGVKVVEVPVNWKEIEGSKLVLLPATISFFRDYFAMLTFYNIGFWSIKKVE